MKVEADEAFYDVEQIKGGFWQTCVVAYGLQQPDVDWTRVKAERYG